MKIRNTEAGRSRRSGSVLVIAIMAVMLVAVLGTGYMQLQASVTRRQMHAVDTKRAFYLAEAGLAEGFTGLKMGRTGSVGTPEQPAVFGDGLLWVEATDHGPGRVQFECTALVGTGRATLGMVAEQAAVDSARLGMFADGDVVVREGALIDGWDSSLGTYADQLAPDAVPPHVESTGQLVGSNGAIALIGSAAQPTRVYGDVTAGPDLSVGTSGTVTVTGEKKSADDPFTLPAVEPPDIAKASGLTLAGVEPFHVPSGEAGYEFLKVESGAELVLVGPLRLLVGGLSVAEGASLTFDTENGAVELVVETSAKLAPGSKVTTSDTDPSLVALRVAGEQGDAPEPLVALAGLGAFYGTVYAPDADVALSSPFEVFGWVTAGGLDIGREARVHVDRALSVTGENGVIETQYGGWRIVDLSQVAGATRTSDPFQALGLDPAALDTPADSHDLSDVVMTVHYEAVPGGPVLTFTGPESGFDFDLVSTVVDIVRRVVR